MKQVLKMQEHLAFTLRPYYNCIRKQKRVLRGGVRFPTGGDTFSSKKEESTTRLLWETERVAEPVRIRDQQYSLDERRNVSAVRHFAPGYFPGFFDSFHVYGEFPSGIVPPRNGADTNLKGDM